MLLVRKPAAVYHCRSCLVFLNGSFSALSLLRIDSLLTDSTRALTSRVLDYISFLPDGMTSLTEILGLKCICVQFLIGFLLFVFIGWILQSV